MGYQKDDNFIIKVEQNNDPTIRQDVDSLASSIQDVDGKVDDITAQLTSKATTESVTTLASQLADIVIQAENFTGTDTQKLQSAINAGAGKKVRLKDGKTYLIDSAITGVSNIEIIGNNTTIKAVNGTRTLDGLLSFDNKQDIKISGVTFDMNMQNAPVYLASEYANRYNVGLHFNICTNVSIEKCKFINLYNHSIFAWGCRGIFGIKECYFSSPLQTQNQKADHIVIGTFDGILDIEDNHIVNDLYSDAQYGVCGIQLSGTRGKGSITNNYLINCGRNNVGSHPLRPIDLYADCDNVNIENNRIISLHGIVNISRSRNISFHNNVVEILEGSFEYLLVLYSDAEFENTKNIKINNNRFISKVTASAFGIAMYTSDWGKKIENVEVFENTFLGYWDRCIDVALPIRNITIENNQAKADNNGNMPKDGIFIRRAINEPSSILGTETNSSCSGLTIKNNELDITGTNDVNLNGYLGNKQDYILIENNKINGNGSNTYLLHVFKAKSRVENNTLNNASIGFYLRGTDLIYCNNNIADNCTTPYNYADAVGYVKFLDNWTNGKQLFEGSITFDPGALVDGAREQSGTVVCTGATIGDFALVSAPYDLQGIMASAYVFENDHARIVIYNKTGLTIDLASGIWKVKVIKN